MPSLTSKSLCTTRVSLVAQMIKNLLVIQETWAQSLDWEEPLEKGTATHSGIPAGRMPQTEEPGRMGVDVLGMTEQCSRSCTVICNVHLLSLFVNRHVCCDFAVSFSLL